MRGETVVVYNGVTMANVQTSQFRQEAVYDSSGTDLLYYRFTIAIVGTITQSGSRTHTSYPGQPTVLPGAAAQYAALRAALLKPRQSFLMTRGVVPGVQLGEVLLKAEPMGRAAVPTFGAGASATHFDVNNGPKPRRVELTQTVANTTVRVEFEIEICKVECDENGNASGNTAGVLNHRWSCTDAIDANFYTTRTFHGRLVTVGGSLNPHALRQWVVPRLTIGFRRDSMTFRASEDGLTLEYTIVDREVAFAPPRPATSWAYSYREATGDGKGWIHGSVDVRLSGPRNVDKGKLIEICVAIFESKLLGDQGDGVIVESIELTDSYGDHENSVHFSAMVRRMPKVEGRVGTTFGILAKNLGKPIDKGDLQGVVDDYNSALSRGGYNDEPIYVAGPVGIVGAFVAYLQTPCDDTHTMISAEVVGEADEDDDAALEEPTIDAYIAKDLPDTQPDRLSKEHRDNPYTIWEIDSKYQTDDHRIALPVASQIGSSGPSLVVGAVAPPTSRRIIRIRGQRIGEQPEIPEPKRSYAFLGGTATRLRYVVTPEDPRKTADNKYIYSVTAELEYALSQAPDSKTSLPIGTNVWEDPAFATREAKNFVGTAKP